jgi:aldehyde:ferredoxin oxidoreductase
MKEENMNGYTENILRINLTDRKITTIPTHDYKQWIGGHGMGSAIFFDLVKDKTIDGFDPANVVTLMTSPLSGTLVPAGAGRTEVQGIGVQSYPIGWFTRSNFGGRFSPMLKYAGWDGIVIEGKADKPVWIDIRNDNVKIRDCGLLSLWGTDTWECQKRIWKYVAQSSKFGDWIKPDGEKGDKTTQRPAVLATGPAGENLSRVACLIHDAGNGSGQGGFGAVWGSKNLKAISVIGMGSIRVHDPKSLLEARLWFKKQYEFDLKDLKTTDIELTASAPPVPGVLWGNYPEKKRGEDRRDRPTERQRPQACIGCHSGCRARYESGLGNESTCVETIFYPDAGSLEVQRKTSDLLNKYGLNAFEMAFTLPYLRELNKMGVLGPGKAIDCPLDFAKYGSLEFADQFLRMAAYRNDGLGNKHSFGNDLAEGVVRAAKKWGRLDEDLRTGVLTYSHWGVPLHFDPRTQLEWGYGTILGDRDINEHDFRQLYGQVIRAEWMGENPKTSAEELVKICSSKMVPFEGDLLMLDYSDENMYSEHMAKLVSWHRYFTRFWKQSALFCDWRWPDFVNLNVPDKVGSTGKAEPRFFNAVTGKDFTFLDGVELGRKIWNLDHAIWTLQGRHRDMVHFADYVYKEPAETPGGTKELLSGVRDGKWDYYDYCGRHLDRDKFERFKDRFYKLQGWDVATGYPTEKTLKSLGLGHVANELREHKKLK